MIIMTHELNCCLYHSMKDVKLYILEENPRVVLTHIIMHRISNGKYQPIVLYNVLRGGRDESLSVGGYQVPLNLG